LKAKIQEQEQTGGKESIEHKTGEKFRYVFLIPHEAKDAIDSTQNNHRRQKCDTADKDNVDLGHETSIIWHKPVLMVQVMDTHPCCISDKWFPATLLLIQHPLTAYLHLSLSLLVLILFFLHMAQDPKRRCRCQTPRGILKLLVSALPA